MATIRQTNTRLKERRWQALALQLQRELFLGRCGSPHHRIHVHLAMPWNHTASDFLEKETAFGRVDLWLRATIHVGRTQLAARLRI